MSPFDIKNLIDSKGELPEWDDQFEKDYVPFIINRAFSFNMGTVLFANEMNISPALSKKQQFDFLYYGVPKGKRFDKWIKQTKLHEDIEMLQNYYSINNRVAVNLASLLTDSQLSEIRKITRKGGIK